MGVHVCVSVCVHHVCAQHTCASKCVCACTCMSKKTTYLFEMEVSRISKHFSFHLFGLPGNWESGMLFSLSISVTNASALCVRVCMWCVCVCVIGEGVCGVFVCVGVGERLCVLCM